MADTVVGDFTGWLAEQLAAVVGFTVHTGWPGVEAGKELVWFGDIEEAETSPCGMRAGRIRREENFELPVVIEVSADGRSQRQADERATELKAAIGSFLADNVQAIGAVSSNQQIVHALMAGWRQYRAPIERKGHWSSWVSMIRVKARIL